MRAQWLAVTVSVFLIAAEPAEAGNPGFSYTPDQVIGGLSRAATDLKAVSDDLVAIVNEGQKLHDEVFFRGELERLSSLVNSEAAANGVAISNIQGFASRGCPNEEVSEIQLQLKVRTDQIGNSINTLTYLAPRLPSSVAGDIAAFASEFGDKQQLLLTIISYKTPVNRLECRAIGAFATRYDQILSEMTSIADFLGKLTS